MTDQWTTAVLADVAQIVGGGTPSTKVPRFWGGDVAWLAPTEVVRQDGMRIKRSERTITREGLASSSAKLLPRNTVLVTTRASVGFTALADVELATNQGFQSLIPGPQLLPEFLMFWVQANRDEFTRRAGGSTFPEINKSKVKSIPITYPPLPVQRRIVDLMQHLDAHISNLDDELGRARSILDTWLDSWLVGRQPSHERLGRVCTFRSGPSWKAQDERREPGPNARRVLKITNTQPSGRIDLTDETYVAGLPATTRTISDTSIVMIRTNGNRSRIGNVYLPTPDMEGFAVSAFQFLGEAESSAARDFIYWLLSAPSNQSLMSAQASGSTGLGNLASGWLREFPIPESTQDERNQFVATARSLSSLLTALEQECRDLRGMRVQILGALLSRFLQLPDSYDALLGVA